MGMRQLTAQISVVLLLLVLATGCGGPRTRGGTTHAPPPVITRPAGPVVVVDHPREVVASVPVASDVGPPAHAPAHGYRAKRGRYYLYYPESTVYFCPDRKLYWYLSNGKWEVTVRLPDSISLSLGDGVSVRVRSDLPYTSYDQHRAEHPSGKDKPEKDKPGKAKNEKGEKAKGPHKKAEFKKAEF